MRVFAVGFFLEEDKQTVKAKKKKNERETVLVEVVIKGLML